MTNKITYLVCLLGLCFALSINTSYAATATITGNQTTFFPGEDFTLSADILAGFELGTAVDIYVAALYNDAVFTLDPTLTWGSNIVPIVANTPLQNLSAPNFYNLPANTLPTGNYVFAIIIVPTGADPLSSGNWLAIGSTNIMFNPQPPPVTDLVFTPPAPTVALLGFPYSFSLCGAQVGGTSDLCGTGGNVAGGSPPYHFALNTGTGFPPLGISLNLNGLLTGTPSVEGTYNFEVCAIDLAANQSCKAVTMIVTTLRFTGSFTGSTTDTFKSNLFCSFRHTIFGSGSITVTSLEPFAASFDVTATDTITVLPGNFPQCTGANVDFDRTGPLTFSAADNTVSTTVIDELGTVTFTGKVNEDATAIKGEISINNPDLFDSPIKGPLTLTR